MDRYAGNPVAADELNVYDAHQKAAAEYQEACHLVQEAQQRKIAADKNLQCACQELTEHIKTSMIDPTGVAEQKGWNGSSAQFDGTAGFAPR